MAIITIANTSTFICRLVKIDFPCTYIIVVKRAWVCVWLTDPLFHIQVHKQKQQRFFLQQPQQDAAAMCSVVGEQAAEGETEKFRQLTFQN